MSRQHFLPGFVANRQFNANDWHVHCVLLGRNWPRRNLGSHALERNQFAKRVLAGQRKAEQGIHCGGVRHIVRLVLAERLGATTEQARSLILGDAVLVAQGADFGPVSKPSTDLRKASTARLLARLSASSVISEPQASHSAKRNVTVPCWPAYSVTVSSVRGVR